MLGDAMEKPMRNYNRKILFPVQIATWVASWLIYRNTNRLWTPTAVFFVSMEISTVFGALWAKRLRENMHTATSSILN
jgi:hypothetical protein